MSISTVKRHYHDQSRTGKSQSEEALLPCSEGTDTTRDAEMQIWHICAPRPIKTLVLPWTLAKVTFLCSIHKMQLDNPVCYTAQTLMVPSASLIGSRTEVSTTLVGAGKSLNYKWQAAAFLKLSIVNTKCLQDSPKKNKLPGTSINISGTGCVCTWLPPTTSDWGSNALLMFPYALKKKGIRLSKCGSRSWCSYTALLICLLRVQHLHFNDRDKALAAEAS